MKNKRLLSFFALILIFALVLGGCASKSYRNDMPMDSIASEEMGSSGSSPSESLGYDRDFSSLDSEKSEEYESGFIEPDKIITTVYISMETKEFTETNNGLNKLIKDNKAYIENSNISHNNYINSSRLKHADYSIRVPRQNLENFMNSLKGIGNIISENTSKEDITKAYRDTESRLRLLETKEERILALLEKADFMEDIIVLENQLSDIIYQKENLSANLLSMDDRVDYSTVHFEIREVAKFTDGTTVKTPFSTRFTNAVRDSAYFFGQNIEGFILFLVYFLPYGIILLVAIVIIKKIKKHIKFKFPKPRKKKDKNKDL